MLRYLLEKEFRQIFRDRMMLRLIMAYPVVILLVLPWATTMEIGEVRMVVEDHDRTDYSRRLVEKMTASDYFIFAGAVDSRAEADESLAKGTADLVLTLPSGWSRSLCER